MPGVTLEENINQVINSEGSTASEIAATARSLKTNLTLCFVFIFSVLCLANFSGSLTVIFVALLKGLIPILTTIANFGTIQIIFALYWHNVSFHFIECFKCAMFSHVFSLTLIKLAV
jgi:hypothetical protein